MATNLSFETLYSFITRDLESAWNAMARESEPGALRGGGNFMFARQAMTLLELACRVCRADTTGSMLRGFSEELARIELRYFTELPADVRGPGPDEFDLPSITSNPKRDLLRLLFDLIRNGQAHQYQQINVDLADAKELQIGLTGVEAGIHIEGRRNRPPEHLGVTRDHDGNVLAILVVTDLLYRDIKAAIERAAIPGSGLTLKYLKRNEYAFSADDLAATLHAAGHQAVPWPDASARQPEGVKAQAPVTWWDAMSKVASLARTIRQALESLLSSVSGGTGIF
jgi:hypothetical protein